jgi:hypothetical protein
MTEFKCTDCGKQAATAWGDDSICLACLNARIKSPGAMALHQAERDYEAFRNAGGRVS